MDIQVVGLKQTPIFRNASIKDSESNTTTNNDLEKAPSEDTFENKNSHPKKKKKHIGRKIFLGTLSTIALIYGGIVLKHKLSKPSLEEVQKCFREIFNKDLSNEEIGKLLDKYKKIIKNENTESFAKEIIEQLKKDYGIEQVTTNVDVKLLENGKLKTVLEHTKLGTASPLGDINIMPRTNSDIVARGNQKEIFNTGFHELKHMKQFADAYRANPDKFVDVLYKRHTTPEIIKDTAEQQKRLIKENTEKLFKNQPELFEGYTLEQVLKFAEDEFLKVHGSYEKSVENATKKDWRAMLDSRFGKLKPYKEGSAEYKAGIEYIEAYAKYPNPEKDYEAYKNNLLEKEAFKNGDLSEKIFKYLKSIWKI